MTISKRLFCIILSFFCGTTLALAAGLSARVSATELTLGDTFELVVSAQDNSKRELPDFETLRRDFTIIRRSESQEFSIINGISQKKQRWILTLRPKRVGRLTIPALRLGNHLSRQITVSVSPNGMPKKNQTAAPRALFIEAALTPRTAYTGQQLRYKVRLFIATHLNLRNLQLKPPKAPQTTVKLLDQQRSFLTLRGNQQYQVVERTFALFPEKIGKITVQGARLEGEAIANQNRRSLQGFFGMTDPWIANTRPFSRQAADMSLTISPPPAQFTHPWLPAENVTLNAHWSKSSPIFRVGEPLTRTITLTAKGVSAAQLPELPQAATPGIKQYHERPQLQTRVQTQTVLSTRQEKTAFIPTQAGHITLPAVTVYWWDTIHHNIRQASLPATRYLVLPAGDAQPTTQHAAPPQVSAKPTPATPPPPPPAPEKEHTLPWGWISAGIFALLWLMALFKMRKKSRRKRPPLAQQTPSHHSAWRTLQRGLKTNPDAATLQSLLLTWAKLHWPHNPPQTLNALALQLDHPPLSRALDALEVQRYGAAPSSETTLPTGQDWSDLLKAALKQQRKKEQGNKKQKQTPLPELYPSSEDSRE